MERYRAQQQEFPLACREAEYEKRLKAAYPIHPEVFDRLYSDWSTLVKSQRPRGVLRLMAAVIHSLWEKQDRNPLILPANIPIDDPRLQFELTRYLPDNRVTVIEQDVDGSNSLPLRIDGERPNLARSSACHRVARTVFLCSAPPAICADALSHRTRLATYLYADGARYWYSAQPTVTKLAEDRAEQFKSDPYAVAEEVKARIS